MQLIVSLIHVPIVSLHWPASSLSPRDSDRILTGAFSSPHSILWRHNTCSLRRLLLENEDFFARPGPLANQNKAHQYTSLPAFAEDFAHAAFHVELIVFRAACRDHRADARSREKIIACSSRCRSGHVALQLLRRPQLPARGQLRPLRRTLPGAPGGIPIGGQSFQGRVNRAMRLPSQISFD